MPNELPIAKRRFQFTIRSLFVMMAVWAGVLAIILWQGTWTAPYVLATAASLAGYALRIPGGPFPAEAHSPRLHIAFCGGMLGFAAGKAIDLQGPGTHKAAIVAGATLGLMIVEAVTYLGRKARDHFL